MTKELEAILNHGIITIEDMQRLTTAELILKIVNKVKVRKINNMKQEILNRFYICEH